MPVYDVYREDGSVTRTIASSKSEASQQVRFVGELIRQVVEVSDVSITDIKLPAQVDIENAVKDDPDAPVAIAIDSPPTRPTDEWEENWELIGTATVKSVGEAQTKCREWDNHFQNGEKGIFTLKFPLPIPSDIPNWLIIFPFALGAGTAAEFSKKNITTQVKSLLEAKGVETWADPDWDGSTFRVYYTVGIAPLAIAIIVIGALIAFGILAITISNYKIRKIEVDAYNDRQQQLTDAFIDAVNEVEDPADRAKLLNDRSESEAETYKTTSTPSLVEAGVQVLEKPAIIIAFAVAALIGVVAVLKVVKK